MKKRFIAGMLSICMVFSGFIGFVPDKIAAQEQIGGEVLGAERTEMSEELSGEKALEETMDVEASEVPNMGASEMSGIEETEKSDAEAPQTAVIEVPNVQMANEEVTAQEAESLAENSWRYTNGVWTGGNTDDSRSYYSAHPNAWGKVDGYFVNDKGQKIEGTLAKGIDVSEHNGVIDWNQVKASGIDYAIIRCGYGDNYSSQDDKRWKYNVSECVRLNIPFGVYIYSYAMSVADARSEAEHVLRLIRGYNLSYPVFLDMENEGGSYNQGGLPAKTLGDIAETFCNTISAAGYEAGIYANLNWFTRKLTDSRFSNWKKWVAQYNSVCDYKGDYIMWQCTSSGKVPGIYGNVDLNFLFEEGHWESDSYGNKYYYMNGKPVKGGKKIGDAWYYFDLNTGVMYKNMWRDKEGRKYYYDENGRLVSNKGLKIDGYWYYFNASGAMFCEEWRDKAGKKYYYDGNGHLVSNIGLKIDGYWYYFNASGAMLCEEWRDKGGKKYYYDGEGHLVSSVGLKIDGYWYYFNASGAMLCEEWRDKGGKKYYYDRKGHLVSNVGLKIEGFWYYFNASGAMLCEEWRDKGGKKYYYDRKGHLVSNVGLKIEGFWYYFNASGAMLCEEWRDKEGEKYYYDEYGHLVSNRGLKINDYWYYFGAGGAMYREKWRNKEEKYYYYDWQGHLISDTIMLIDGKKYFFDKSGAAHEVE